jgi:ABC-type bacteriocin/lantibiotic exporter with double-glycine peptidase domain
MCFFSQALCLRILHSGDSEISEEQVIEAAKMIGAHQFIQKLPGGYHYQVMERGATLSMGQRQLISFVRALVFNPDILILDEATSSIDPESEAIIQHAIEKLMARRTSIIIAHRTQYRTERCQYSGARQGRSARIRSARPAPGDGERKISRTVRKTVCSGFSPFLSR